MRGKMTFFAGLAIGYVLGAKAGRERYEQLMRTAQRVRANPTVQEAAGLVQSQTTRMMSSGTRTVRSKMNQRLGDTRLGNSRVGKRLLGDSERKLMEETTTVPPPSHF